MRPANARVQIDTADAAVTTADFATAVRHFLSQQPRQLPSRFLYDPLGSALFDAICHLPWYRVTAGETRLLIGHGRDILSHLRPLGRIVELGAGNGDKLAALLSSAPPRTTPLDLDLIDISPAALATASRALSAFDQVRVFAHESSYEDGLLRLGREPAAAGRTLMLFLGSNIGNYDPDCAAAFLLQARAALRPGDALLLGTDLVKDPDVLEAAYDDAQGVTAAFNRNVLTIINRELGADFPVERFEHVAFYDPERRWIEMRLRARRACVVTIPAIDLEVSFQRGEEIRTEISTKFTRSRLESDYTECGLELTGWLTDPGDRFALSLARAV